LQVFADIDVLSQDLITKTLGSKGRSAFPYVQFLLLLKRRNKEFLT